ncbi:protein D3-like [Episyrphus balteatus]|uniref:protein D3-like n=1 Tax=Episyrphus balteatus TaxID=286459 RepID=UPI0024853765|nr:protein D3-like [Episyrphus balteatus]
MIKLILIVATIISFALAATDSEMTKKMKKFKIIPQIVSGNVPELLKITFDSGASVNMGNKILPSQAKNQPKVEWNADKHSFYTIVCFDADAPSPADPSLSKLVTWMVGNIPGNDIASGHVLAPYIAVSPPKGKQWHRAVWLVYKQPSKLKFDEPQVDKYTLEGRTNYPLEEFLKKNGIGEPVAGNFCMTKFDPHVLDVYKRLICCNKYNEEKESL